MAVGEARRVGDTRERVDQSAFIRLLGFSAPRQRHISHHSTQGMHNARLYRKKNAGEGCPERRGAAEVQKSAAWGKWGLRLGCWLVWLVRSSLLTSLLLLYCLPCPISHLGHVHTNGVSSATHRPAASGRAAHACYAQNLSQMTYCPGPGLPAWCLNSSMNRLDLPNPHDEAVACLPATTFLPVRLSIGYVPGPGASFPPEYFSCALCGAGGDSSRRRNMVRRALRGRRVGGAWAGATVRTRGAVAWGHHASVSRERRQAAVESPPSSSARTS